MTIDKILTYLQLAYIVTITITYIVTVIRNHTKNKKIIKDCDNALMILFKIQNLITKAEAFSNWSGEEKKNYVMSLIYNEAREAGIDEEQVDNLIEQFVFFTNQVNINKKGDNKNGTENTAN